MPMDPRSHLDELRDPAERTVQVWDLPVRCFHWLTVLLVGLAWMTERLNWIDLHVRVGETLLALVLFRLLWGCLGSDTARFRRFLASPASAWRHLRHVLRREPDREAGHNPAGGWMVMLLLALLAVETLSGLYLYNDIEDEGPLSEHVPAVIANAIAALHAIGWDILFAAVVLHLFAIALYAFAKGQNLVRPMVTGRKRLPGAMRAPRMASLWLAVVLAGIAALVTALLAVYV